MQKVWSALHSKKEAGFSAVEVLLATALFGLLVTALVGALIYGRQATADAGDHQRATYLAEEGLEAARNIGNASYANLVNGTFGIAQTGGVWAFSGSSDTADVFTRQVAISDAGTNRKTITSTVTWPQQGGGTNTVTLTSRLSNWKLALIVESWANAILSGSADATGNLDALKVAILGDYAYVVRNTTANNFVVVNIANPDAPSIVSTTTIAGTPTNIAGSGSYVYVTNASDTAEFQVISVSNPLAPTVSRTLNFTGNANAQSIVISGDYAYVTRAADSTSGANEFTVVNILFPQFAAVAGGYNNNISMNGVYYNNGYAYVSTTSTSSEMLTINVTTPTTPALAHTYNAPASVAATTVWGYGSYVFLAQGTSLLSLDISSPASPTLSGNFTAAGTVNNIKANDTGAYLFLGTSGSTAEFQVLNSTNPASLSLAKSVNTSSTINGLAYDATADIVVGASAADAQEIVVFTKN